MYELRKQLPIDLKKRIIRENLDLEERDVLSVKEIVERVRSKYPDIDEDNILVQMSFYNEDQYYHESSEVFFLREETDGEFQIRIKDLVDYNNRVLRKNKESIDLWNERHIYRKVEGDYLEIIDRFTKQRQKEFNLEDYV